MPKGYWIGRVDVSDPEAYKAYVTANAAPIAAHGGRFLVRGGPVTALEGRTRARNVLLEFPSFEAALACYHSPGYQAAVALRQPVAVADLVVVEGTDAPDAALGGPAPGYWIMGIDVIDPEGYRAYAAAGGTAAYKPRFLVRGGRQEQVEGTGRARQVVLAFADVPQALACYQAPDYQRAVALRQGAAEVDLLLIPGYEGPQPGESPTLP
ncbi:DUF1330 domain-containing protein [Aquabacter sediminis]|uniref:DUF1330 domain-containing protein n=1 Tax=Aquabacter sediminis TaxID=3029197 RepID=UPI0031580FDB